MLFCLSSFLASISFCFSLRKLISSLRFFICFYISCCLEPLFNFLTCSVTIFCSLWSLVLRRSAICFFSLMIVSICFALHDFICTSEPHSLKTEPLRSCWFHTHTFWFVCNSLPIICSWWHSSPRSSWSAAFPSASPQYHHAGFHLSHAGFSWFLFSACYSWVPDPWSGHPSPLRSQSWRLACQKWGEGCWGISYPFININVIILSIVQSSRPIYFGILELMAGILIISPKCTSKKWKWARTRSRSVRRTSRNTCRAWRANSNRWRNK